MILTDSDLEKRNNSEENLANVFHKDIILGRNGSIERPPFLRNLILLTAEKDTIKNVASALEVSPSSISAYKRNESSLNPDTKTEKKELKEVNESKIEKTRSRALDIVNIALEQITEEKLEGAKLREIASIAKDMSIVHEKMTEEKREEGNRIQVVIMTPRMRQEEDMEVIEIGVK